jgi:hypothetical protein
MSVSREGLTHSDRFTVSVEGSRDQTVGNILKAHGIEPAPELKGQSSWKTFLKSHWDVLGAIDFTTVEIQRSEPVQLRNQPPGNPPGRLPDVLGGRLAESKSDGRPNDVPAIRILWRDCKDARS